MVSDILVIGAGPVGMLAALLADRQGLRVVLLEQTEHRHRQSRAVGIMPPTLEILHRLDLAEAFVTRGVPIRSVEAHGRRTRLGGLDLAALPGRYPFVLSLPQDRTEALLEQTVLTRSSIRFLRGHRVIDCRQDAGGVMVRGKQGRGGSFRVSGQYVLGCDGGRSTARQALGIPFEGDADSSTFTMGDYADCTGWGSQARFYLTPRGSVESFPLPDRRRRFVLRTPALVEDQAGEYLRAELRWRAGVDLPEASPFWQSSFRVRRFLARSFVSGRVFLCGDAAHLMSPVGGLNMNIGFADAELAVWLIVRLLDNRASLPAAARLYQRTRRRAAHLAARRAHLLMRGGTSGGSIWSALRNGAVAAVLHSPARRRLVPPLGMQTLPFRHLARWRTSFEGELASGTLPELSG